MKCSVMPARRGLTWLLSLALFLCATGANAQVRAWLDRSSISLGETVTLNVEGHNGGEPDFSVLANRMPPIGIMQMASWLEKFGHSVALHDCLGPYAPPGIAANAEIVLATEPEMVGFSATTSGLPRFFCCTHSASKMVCT